MGEKDLNEIESTCDEHNEVQRPDLVAFLNRWDRDLSEDRRTYGVKLCFAGAESKKIRDGLFRVGVRHISVSYFYLRKWFETTSLQEIGEDLGRFDFIFLDSGAHTFISAAEKEKDLKVDLRGYAKKYYEILPRMHHMFAGCAEIDFGDEFSQAEMETTREELISKGVNNMVPVYHGQDVSVLKEYGWFEGYSYLGVSSTVLCESSLSGKLREFMSLSKENGNLVHGFGVTDVDVLLKSQLYSVASASWISGSKYGQTAIFQNGRIRYYEHEEKSVRRRFKSRFEEAGLIWSDIEADKHFEVNMMNAVAWKQWADYVKYNANNCYWLNSEEKDKALDLKSLAFNAEGIISRKDSIERAERRRLDLAVDAGHDDRAHETLYCSQCYVSGRCPRFKSNQQCGYDVNIRLATKADLQKALQNILEVGYGRVMTGVLFEKLEGGVLDKNVSVEMEKFLKMLERMKSIMDTREELTIKAKGGKGTVSQMLAKVFLKGSGNTQTQRAATSQAESEVHSEVKKDGMVIDVEPENN